MKTSLIAIGNSRGVRIPKPLLEESGITDEVEIRAKKGQITIAPSRKKTIALNDEYLMSLSSLDDWNNPQENKAWAHLQ